MKLCLMRQCFSGVGGSNVEGKVWEIVYVLGAPVQLIYLSSITKSDYGNLSLFQILIVFAVAAIASAGIILDGGHDYGGGGGFGGGGFGSGGGGGGDDIGVASISYVKTPVVSVGYVAKPVVSYVAKPVATVSHAIKPVVTYTSISSGGGGFGSGGGGGGYGGGHGGGWPWH
nr:glycine-rich cell wall structural protein 2-like [Rhipicephalus microplus]